MWSKEKQAKFASLAESGTEDEFRQVLEKYGETPLPKYIKRKPDEEDRERYQTVYAKHQGAVAAPTAGLHFSRELIKRCEIGSHELFSDVAGAVLERRSNSNL